MFHNINCYYKQITTCRSLINKKVSKLIWYKNKNKALQNMLLKCSMLSCIIHTDHKTENNCGFLLSSWHTYPSLHLSFLCFLSPVVLWNSDVGVTDQRSEPLPRGRPVRHHTLPLEGAETPSATVLSWSTVSLLFLTCFKINKRSLMIFICLHVLTKWLRFISDIKSAVFYRL